MRILVADDDERVRAALRAMLEAAGYEVVEAADGAEAVRAFRRAGADVVFCDLFMPGRDGLEVIGELRRQAPVVKVIATSGGGFGGTVDMLPAARMLGAAATLLKPFTRAEALAAIEEVLRAPAPA